jgi:hypothetical protein
MHRASLPEQEGNAAGMIGTLQSGQRRFSSVNRWFMGGDIVTERVNSALCRAKLAKNRFSAEHPSTAGRGMTTGATTTTPVFTFLCPRPGKKAHGILLTG